MFLAVMSAVTGSPSSTVAPEATSQNQTVNQTGAAVDGGASPDSTNEVCYCSIRHDCRVCVSSVRSCVCVSLCVCGRSSAQK